MSLSPSLTRRYFERVRPADPRIPFYLLRFYLGQGQTDDNLLDKVDYLATVVAAGSPDPARPLPAPRRDPQALRRGCSGPRPGRADDDTAPQIATAFDEMTAQIAAVGRGSRPGRRGLVRKPPHVKRRSPGAGASRDPDGGRSCNLTARAAFRVSTRRSSGSCARPRIGSERSNSDPRPGNWRTRRRFACFKNQDGSSTGRSRRARSAGGNSWKSGRRHRRR